jgi:hypothetical protein
MDHRILVAGLAAVTAGLILPAAASGGAQGIYVEAGDANRFSPRVGMYGVIHPNFGWTWGDPGDDGRSDRRHNVVHDDGLFRSGDPVKTAPGPGDYFQLSASGGTFRYHCAVHGAKGGVGMSGKIKVPLSDGAPEPDGVPVIWAVKGNTTGNRYDVRFKVEDGRWRDWKRGTAQKTDIFGRADDPVNFSGLKTYTIQARSKLGSDPDRRSDWSPSLILG